MLHLPSVRVGVGRQGGRWATPGKPSLHFALGLGRDLDLLKARLMDEVEAPYRSKCENLAKVCV